MFWGCCRELSSLKPVARGGHLTRVVLLQPPSCCMFTALPNQEWPCSECSEAINNGAEPPWHHHVLHHWRLCPVACCSPLQQGGTWRVRGCIPPSRGGFIPETLLFLYFPGMFSAAQAANGAPQGCGADAAPVPVPGLLISLPRPTLGSISVCSGLPMCLLLP